MSTNLILRHNNDDGWNDAAIEAGERPIKGTLLKSVDWRWLKGSEGLVLEDGTVLVALETIAAWVKWEGGKPVQYVFRQPGKRLPDREELPDQDQSTWEQGPDGKPRDPWQNTRFLYLVDQTTAEVYTFSTSSVGGRIAVNDLGAQIARMRNAHPHAVPIVELRSAPMQTRFGKKSKPWFKVVGWLNLNDPEPLAVAGGNDGGNRPPAITAPFNDDIPI